MSLFNIPMQSTHPDYPNFTRTIDVGPIKIGADEFALELKVNYYKDGVFVQNQTLVNPASYVLRATPDSPIYRNAQTKAIMEYEEGNPLCFQEHALFMAAFLGGQEINVKEIVTGVVLEYEALNRFNN
jgi:hypothetical protein